MFWEADPITLFGQSTKSSQREVSKDQRAEASDWVAYYPPLSKLYHCDFWQGCHPVQSQLLPGGPLLQLSSSPYHTIMYDLRISSYILLPFPKYAP